MGESKETDSTYQELNGEEGRKKIAELVKGIRIGMLTTQAKDGSMDARPMAVQDKPFDGTLWFLTRRSSEKVSELGEDRHVTLTFSDPARSKYITLKGRGAATQDRAKVREL
jgi:general stress protein 26